MVVKSKASVNMVCDFGSVYSPRVPHTQSYQDKRSDEFCSQFPCLKKVKGEYMGTASNRTLLKAELIELGCNDFMFSIICRCISRSYEGAVGATSYWAG